MTINQIKKEMLEWTDFYGQDITSKDMIENAKTKNELSEVLDAHSRFLEDQAIDAQSHLNNFRKKIGVSSL